MLCPECIHVSVNSFLVSAIETTFLNQSGPNLHEVFMGPRSRMSLIVSEIRPVIAPEILKIAVFDLVSKIETTFLNQSSPKLHKVFVGIISRMSSIMIEIRPVTWKLLALELLKNAVLNLVSTKETTFLNQSGPKLHKVFIATRYRMSSIMSEICLVTPKLFALELLKNVVYICIFTIVIALVPTFIDGF